MEWSPPSTTGIAPARTTASTAAFTNDSCECWTTPGFDVSNWQGTVDWAGAYKKGARFAYIKATEGTTYRDPSFNTNYTKSYSAGFIRGAYHFATPDSSTAKAQADLSEAKAKVVQEQDRTRAETEKLIAQVTAEGETSENRWEATRKPLPTP